jgi:hypothetical protein
MQTKNREPYVTSLQTIPVSDAVMRAIAGAVRPPSIASRTAEGVVRLPDMRAILALSADFRQALHAITEGERHVVANHPVFGPAATRLVMIPATDGSYRYLPESPEALVADALRRLESDEVLRADLRRCQLAEVFRECGKPDDPRSCEQFYFMSLRTQHAKTVTGERRRTATGGRNPSLFCCPEHTLMARRIRETYYKSQPGERRRARKHK